MPVGVASNFRLYDEQFQAGVFEGLAQVVDVLNGGSNGCLMFEASSHRGNFLRDAFFGRLSNSVSRRDPNSVAPVASISLSQDENIAVKLHRRFGPVEHTISGLQLIGMDDKALSVIIGQQYAQEKAKDILNTGILALEAAITGVGGPALFDATGQAISTMTQSWLVKGRGLLGDRMSALRCNVTHSKPYNDLTFNNVQVATSFEAVGSSVLAGAQPPTLNIPVVMADIPALLNAGAPDTYTWLMLQSGALEMKESATEQFEAQVVLGNDNLTVKMQGEYTFTVGIRGFKWKEVSGANPDNATLGTASNWIQNVASVKDIAGIRVLVH